MLNTTMSIFSQKHISLCDLDQLLMNNISLQNLFGICGSIRVINIIKDIIHGSKNKTTTAARRVKNDISFCWCSHFDHHINYKTISKVLATLAL